MLTPNASKTVGSAIPINNHSLLSLQQQKQHRHQVSHPPTPSHRRDARRDSTAFVHDNDTYSKATERPSQPQNSIVCQLPANIILSVLQHVDQFDLTRLCLTCSSMYELAAERLYQRVSVILDGQLPLKYDGNARQFIRDNGIKYMDTSLILQSQSLVLFFQALRKSPRLVSRIKYFVFDKCYPNEHLLSISNLQGELIRFFGRYSHNLHFFHITFVDFIHGIAQLTDFLGHENVRQKIFKLFVTSLDQLYTPIVPPGLTNVFLMLDELELMKHRQLDLGQSPFNILNSLFTLTVSTNQQFGLHVLQKLKLFNNDHKLKLKGLTLFHCHKEDLGEDVDVVSNTMHSDNPEFNQYLAQMDKRLSFATVESKIDLYHLQHLYLKIDCFEHHSCNCFGQFLSQFAKFATQNNGLPNLVSFELELYPNFEWLRPHQMLENCLTPLGHFIRTLTRLERLTVDFSTPAFKMFDNSMEMSSLLLNKLNERLMEAFFLCFASARPAEGHLKSLQLPDFLTSFIYYKPDFDGSFLSTCRCAGCQGVLHKLHDMFYPIYDVEDDLMDVLRISNEEEPDRTALDIDTTYYTLIGFILGKLQADREVCVPIKQQAFAYAHYPIYKGQPHTLHHNYHDTSSSGNRGCKCDLENDPCGLRSDNIDTLVTTYIIHQSQPVVEYIMRQFPGLETLMIHGIYYEVCRQGDRAMMMPVFDASEYPEGMTSQ